MNINEKKMQISMYELLQETEEAQKELASGDLETRVGIVGFYLTLDKQVVKDPTYLSLQKQAEDFKAQAESLSVQSGLFSKLGSRVDKAIDKTMGVITEQMVSIAPMNDSRSASVILYDKETISKYFGVYVVESLEQLVEASNQKAVVSLDKLGVRLKDKGSIPKGLELGVLFDSVEDIVRLKSETDSVRVIVDNMIYRVIAGLSMEESFYATINICKLERNDVIAINIIKLVNKGSDDGENEFTGICNEVSIEALCVDRNNKSRLLKCRDTFDSKSTIVVRNKCELIAYGNIEYEVDSAVISLFDDMILEYYNTSVKEVSRDADRSKKLSLLIVPKGYDLSSSFKAKYI